MIFMADSDKTETGSTASDWCTPQMEDIVTRIQDEKAGGVAIRTVKSFLSKIPSVVSGLYHKCVCVCASVFVCVIDLAVQ